MTSSIHITSNPPLNEWRTFVEQNPAGNIFQTPEMYQVFNATKHYDAFVHVSVNPDNQIKALIMAGYTAIVCISPVTMLVFPSWYRLRQLAWMKATSWNRNQR